MVATHWNRFCSIFLCFLVVESYSYSDDSSRGQHHSTLIEDRLVEILQDNGDNAHADVRLQTSANDENSLLRHVSARQQTVHAAQPQTQLQGSESWKVFWTHPLALGILLGLFLRGPDHVGTLMALSTLTSDVDAFKRGFYWGVGHSSGVVLLCPIILTVEHITTSTVSRTTWGYYGDILIGLSMIAVGAYFMYNENWYLQKMVDGTYVAKGCGCHGLSSPTKTSTPATQSSTVLNSESPNTHVVAQLYSAFPASTAAVARSNTASSETVGSENGISVSASTWHFTSSSLLGVFQGLCCPVGLAAGTGFISRVSSTASTPMLLGFIATFALASGVGSGLISLAWGILTRTGSGRRISGRVVYIATCTLLLLFGVVWLVAHRLGVLQHLNFEHKVQQGLISALF